MTNNGKQRGRKCFARSAFTPFVPPSTVPGGRREPVRVYSSSLRQRDADCERATGDERSLPEFPRGAGNRSGCGSSRLSERHDQRDGRRRDGSIFYASIGAATRRIESPAAIGTFERDSGDDGAHESDRPTTSRCFYRRAPTDCDGKSVSSSHYQSSTLAIPIEPSTSTGDQQLGNPNAPSRIRHVQGALRSHPPAESSLGRAKGDSSRGGFYISATDKRADTSANTRDVQHPSANWQQRSRRARSHSPSRHDFGELGRWKMASNNESHLSSNSRRIRARDGSDNRCSKLDPTDGDNRSFAKPISSAIYCAKGAKRTATVVAPASIGDCRGESSCGHDVSPSSTQRQRGRPISWRSRSPTAIATDAHQRTCESRRGSSPSIASAVDKMDESEITDARTLAAAALLANLTRKSASTILAAIGHTTASTGTPTGTSPPPSSNAARGPTIPPASTSAEICPGIDKLILTKY